MSSQLLPSTKWRLATLRKRDAPLAVCHGAFYPDMPGLKKSFPRKGSPTVALRKKRSKSADLRSDSLTRRCQAIESSTDAPTLQVEFDNESDELATIVSIEGENQADILLSVTGAFSSLDLSVQDAMIKTTDGRVLDVFRVTTSEGKQVDVENWDLIRGHILSACGNSNRSSKPAIYGVAATSEEVRHRPITFTEEDEPSHIEETAAELEAAARDMQQSAAELLKIEQDLAAIRAPVPDQVTKEDRKEKEDEDRSANSNTPTSEDVAVEPQEEVDSTSAVQVDEQQVAAQLSARAEAAAVLERRMAAMEAILSARRSSEGLSVEGPPAQRGAGAEGRFLVSGGTGTGPAAGSGYEIILQAFNWESCKQNWYSILKEQVSEFGESGFTSIWLPPFTDSVSAQGYLPRDLYCFDTKYGSESELRDMIKLIDSKGLKAIADVVINHRCAHYQDDQGRWNRFGGRLAWDQRAICSNNPAFGGAGGLDTGDSYDAAPNIDHTQDFVRKDLKEWLKYARRSLGFHGWRFDYVKGYSGKFTREYIDASVPELAVGEYWDSCDYTDGVLDYNQDKHRQRTVDWCDATGGTSAAFDFTTKGILQEAVGRNERWRLVDAQGRPPGVVGIWPSRAILFIENHDTGSTLGHWPFPRNHLQEGYTYILTHPGTPCVFYDHYYQNDNGLRECIISLIRIRKRAGIHSRSRVKVLKAASEVYAAMIDDSVCMKIGHGDFTPDQHTGQWTLETSGSNFAVWLNSKAAAHAKL